VDVLVKAGFEVNTRTGEGTGKTFSNLIPQSKTPFSRSLLFLSSTNIIKSHYKYIY